MVYQLIVATAVVDLVGPTKALIYFVIRYSLLKVRGNLSLLLSTYNRIDPVVHCLY